jgi:Fur family ferric uptake transcriptional regulator
VELERALRDHGHRVTRPRQVVWDVLTGSDRHLSAPEIIELVHERDPSINASSTYRVLTLLAELSLVRESRLGDDASTWEPRHADSVIHLVCDACGVVTHHHTPIVDELARDLDRGAGFDVGAIDVRANGRCPGCRGG